MKNSRFLTLAFLLLTTLFLSISAQAKDEWIQIHSKNFFLLGNASEKDIRKVGTRLEQFRETFRLLFQNMNLTSPIPTNVIVFKSESSYRQFKPKRADGKIDNFVAGYFQPGEDVNYITLSTEGEDAETFSTIFHEYVHSIVNSNFGKSEVPPWFNEGLAEYYATFAIEDNQKVELGLPQNRHLELLNQTRLMPLQTLFNVSNSQLLESGGHSRSIFYAESWALIHYFIQSGKSDALSKFLHLILNGTAPETAFQTAFQINYTQMESELRKYVGQSRYNYHLFTFKDKLVFDKDMQASPLDEAAANTYLGDLLYHTRREDDAEPFLLNALKQQPNSSMANTTLGMVKMKQRKFDEAKKYLENAFTGDQKNHLAFYRYAYLLSREGRDEFGYVQAFPIVTAEKMREALKKSIAINPSFSQSYELLAFVDLVNNEDFDNAVGLMKKALSLQPGNQSYAMRIAELYLRQKKFTEATAIVEKIVKTTDDPELRQRAENLIATTRQMQEFMDRQALEQKRYDGLRSKTGGPIIWQHRETEPPMTRAEIAKAQAEANLRAVNSMLRAPGENEKRAIGHIQKIDCKTRPIVYFIKTAAETFTLTSKDFQALELNAFIKPANAVQVGCDTDLTVFNAVLTYKPATTKINSRGQLITIEFVSDDFRILTSEEINQPPPRIVPAESVDADGAAIQAQPPAQTPDVEKLRHEAMMKAIKSAIRQPADGEKREIGYLDKIECTNKGIFFHIRTTTGTIKLLNATPETLPIHLFTQDLEGIQFSCTLKPIEYPAVFIYKTALDSKTASLIVSLDFVPKTFVLD